MGSIRPGLVSVTYRELAPADIVALSAHEELSGIEWGGDVHVPHGDLGAARRVGALTSDAGLEVAAYGSYYRTGPPGGRGPEFEAVLDTAVALGAPTIRVWAGDRDPSESTGAHRRAIEDDTRRIADLAATARITVAFEFHRGTLTGTAESARQLLSRVDNPHVRSLWQPPEGANDEECLAGLDAVLPWLTNLHVFHWWPDADHRRPLDEGSSRWHRFMDLAATDGRDRFALLEFVEGDDPGVLAREARTLRAWLDRS